MLEIIELLAVVSGCVYGSLLALRKELDFVGVFSVAFIVAFGGGTLRDLILDRHPLFWIANGHYPVVVFVIAAVTSCLPRFPKWARRLLPIPDALGLGLFSVVGAGYALDADVPLFAASMLGVITGTFGGVMGDVIVNEIPSLFRSAPLYATCSFLGCWLLFGLEALGVDPDVRVVVTITAIVTLRFLALGFDLRLPNVARREE